MKRTALAIAAGICLVPAGRAIAAPGELSARDVVFEALAAKADLPSARPALPSLLAEREAIRPDDPDRRGKGAAKAAREAKGAARSEAAKSHAAAARSEAARAAGAAKDDAQRASEKQREEKVRKKPKPPRPGGGGSP